MANTKVKAEQLEAAQTNITSLGTLTALTVDDITIDGSTISDGGDLTLDVAGDIVLDADGGDFYFKDGGTTKGFISTGNNNFGITSSVSDDDIVFTGNDGGSSITALRLDMSDAGTATFNHDIIMNTGGTIRNTSGQELQIGAMVGDGSNTIIKSAGDTIFQYYNGSAWVENVRFDDGNVGIADTTPAEKLSVTGAILSEGDHATGVNAMGAAAGILMHATGDTAYITATSNGNNHRYLSLRALNTGAANAHQVFLSYTGNVGIGTNTPGNTFVVKGAASTSPILEMINSDAEDGNTGRESTIRFSGFRSGGEAMINGQITGTHLDSGDDDKGGLTFFSNNGSGIAERMRLDQWGRLGIGTDSPIAGLSVKATSANQSTYLIHAYRPDGLGHAAEPFSSILIQNQETSAGYQYDGMTIMASHQAHLRFQTGNTGSWGGTGAKRWQLRMGIGNNVDQLSVYSWTAATEVMTMDASATTTFLATSSNYCIKIGTANGQSGMGALNTSYHHTQRLSGPTSFYWSNACYASGGFHTYSDEKLKKEVTLIPDALTKVKKMKGVTFKWTDPDKRGSAKTGKQFGVTAQNMLEIDSELPELSVDPLAEKGKEDTSEKYYTMDYTRITPFLIEAIKEQQTLIETLQTKVAALEAK